jgi:hypothetical protein
VTPRLSARSRRVMVDDNSHYDWLISLESNATSDRCLVLTHGDRARWPAWSWVSSSRYSCDRSHLVDERAEDAGDGALAGKVIIASVAYFASLLILWLLWKDKDVDIKEAFYVGCGL